jgi:hypothetical protein
VRAQGLRRMCGAGGAGLQGHLANAGAVHLSLRSPAKADQKQRGACVNPSWLRPGHQSATIFKAN